jgi:hypothetical protein
MLCSGRFRLVPEDFPRIHATPTSKVQGKLSEKPLEGGMAPEIWAIP